LHAYLTAIENADLRGNLEKELEAGTELSEQERKRLQKVLETGTLPTEEPAITESIPEQTALRP
jgi:hypothetical protein